MNVLRQIATALTTAGLLALTYSCISYFARLAEIELGAFSFSADNTAMINVPFWVGLASFAIGAVLLFFSQVRKRGPVT